MLEKVKDLSLSKSKSKSKDGLNGMMDTSKRPSHNPFKKVKGQAHLHDGSIIPHIVGPFLFYRECTEDNTWHGSILLLVKQLEGDANAAAPAPQPTLNYHLRVGGDKNVDAALTNIVALASDPLHPATPPRHLMDTYGYSAYTYDIAVPQDQGTTNTFVTYWFTTDADLNGDEEGLGIPSPYQFVVPGVETYWHWAFHSCNGFSSSCKGYKMGGLQPLWRDLLARHRTGENPLHALVGGGDQNYMDGVFPEVKVMDDWLAIKNRTKRESAPFTEDMGVEVGRYYFESYCRHFMQPVIRDALASIPNVNVCDDHDLFDGFGSYPDSLQNCPVFQGVFKHAFKYYLLFQHGITGALGRTPKEDGGLGHLYYGQKGYHVLKQFGKTQAVLLLDTRSERSLTQVCSEAAYAETFNRLMALPDSVTHLVSVMAIPMVYPHVEAAEALLGSMSSFVQKIHKTAIFKTGVFNSMLSPFGEPELLDDLVDHWTSSNHNDERVALVRRFQQFALAKSIRVSFLSGDVHLACAGRFHSKESMPEPRDFRLMTQIVSSAMANTPPPDNLVKLLKSSYAEKPLDDDTREEMFNTFSTDVHGKETALYKKFMPRRNYCTISSPHPHHDGLNFSLRVENVHWEDTPVNYNIFVGNLRCTPN